MNQAILSDKLGFTSKEHYNKIRTDVSEITAMLDALHKAQNKQ